MKKQLHANHRSRQREKLRRGQLAPHEHVELMLYYPLKRINTNEISHSLLDELGGVRGMLSADEQTLMNIKGIGPETALFIRNLAEIVRLYELEGCHTDELLYSQLELHKFLLAVFSGVCEEAAIMIMFSEKGRYMDYVKLSDGLDNQAIIPMKKAIKQALGSEAASVIFAHNHKDGICMPSSADEQTANMLNQAFANSNIAVRAHFVVADGKCIEFGKNPR